MKQRISLLLAGLAGLVVLFASGTTNLTGQPLPDKGDTETEVPKGVEVLGRGPVHEAFAEPTLSNSRPTPIVQKKPPDPIEEVPPDQKPEGDNVQWIPGYFAWDDDSSDFIWV